MNGVSSLNSSMKEPLALDRNSVNWFFSITASKHWVPLLRGRKLRLRVMSCRGRCECEAYLFCKIVGTCAGSARRAGFVVGTVGSEGETALPGGIKDYETYVSFPTKPSSKVTKVSGAPTV